MEILATYMAKDGKMFKDPLECEEYEKGLDVIQGSVGDIINYLGKQCKPDDYVHGLVYLKEPDGTKCLFQCATFCIARMQDPFVNLENLDTDQLFIKTQVKEVVEWLGRHDKDCPVQYFLAYSKNIDMSNCGIIEMHNPKLWEKKV